MRVPLIIKKTWGTIDKVPKHKGIIHNFPTKFDWVGTIDNFLTKFPKSAKAQGCQNAKFYFFVDLKMVHILYIVMPRRCTLN